MAIEITSKRKSKVPGWMIISGAVLAVLIIFFSVSYFYFWFNIKKTSQEIQNKESKNPLLEELIKNKEGELSPLQQKINDFDKLISKHQQPLKIFALLEKFCLPKVWFREFRFSSQDNKVTIAARTDNFLILEQQISLLKEQPLIENLTLSDVSISEKGKIDFTFTLFLKPEILK